MISRIADAISYLGNIARPFVIQHTDRQNGNVRQVLCTLYDNACNMGSMSALYFCRGFLALVHIEKITFVSCETLGTDGVQPAGQFGAGK